MSHMGCGMRVRVVVEKRGRIVIPSAIRRALGIRDGMELEVSVEGSRIVLKPVFKISAKDLYGVAGREEVRLEEVEHGLGCEE